MFSMATLVTIKSSPLEDAEALQKAFKGNNFFLDKILLPISMVLNHNMWMQFGLCYYNCCDTDCGPA